MSPLEFLAVIIGLLYLGFITNHQRIGWVFGCISSMIYIFICAQQELFIQSGLQFLYVILGVFGFINWNENYQIRIARISLKSHIGIIVIGLILSLFLGKLMSMTNQQLAYLDAFVSVFAVIATILSTKSILENWIYWLIVNLLSIILFSAQGLQITTVLYFIYLFGSIFGYYNWKKMESTHSQNAEIID